MVLVGLSMPALFGDTSSHGSHRMLAEDEGVFIVDNTFGAGALLRNERMLASQSNDTSSASGSSASASGSLADAAASSMPAGLLVAHVLGVTVLMILGKMAAGSNSARSPTNSAISLPQTAHAFPLACISCMHPMHPASH